jgi:hypothetical protein
MAVPLFLEVLDKALMTLMTPAAGTAVVEMQRECNARPNSSVFSIGHSGIIIRVSAVQIRPPLPIKSGTSSTLEKS